MPLFVWIPAYAGTTTYLSLATFKARGSRDDVTPAFVAPAEAGVQAAARMARRFLWIPAYAGTTMLLSLATFKSASLSR